MTGADFAGLRGWARRSPETVDWLLVGLCALIWLVLLGFGVAAVVALVDLGRGFHERSESPHTGLLYIIIGVSALIILVAIPALLRARQTAPTGWPVGFSARGAATAPIRPGQRMPRAGFDRTGQRRTVAARQHDVVDRVLLRGITELASAIGAALIGVALATYLMAVGKDTGAWVSYGVAGIITVVMPMIPWLYVRQLQGRLS